jgi:hypothetical protein
MKQSLMVDFMSVPKHTWMELFSKRYARFWHLNAYV